MIDGVSVPILFDSGASVSVLSSKVKGAVEGLQSTTKKLHGAGGHKLKVLGQKVVQIEFERSFGALRMFVVDGLTQDCILGVDGLRELDIALMFGSGEVLSGGGILPIQVNTDVNKDSNIIGEVNVDIGDSLSEDQRNQLRNLLNEFSDLFEPVVPGSAKGVEHNILLRDGCQGPIVKKQYRMPLKSQEVVSEHVNKMLADGVIQPSNSPYSAPIVLAPKKDGSTRFCVDYRALNAVTKKDSFPLPRIDDLLDRVRGAKIFSSLDLASGYWQIPMKKTDMEKTAFSTPDGHFEFKVLPFGLTNGPATFQRIMYQVAGKIRSVLVYLDDLLILSLTWEDHLHTLREVFLALRRHAFKLQAKKCHFACPQMLFVGHLIDKDGCRPDPKKLSAIHSIPSPTDVSSLKRFLGLANYYRRFVKNFARIASPLFALLKKGTPWSWTDEHASCFSFLKQKLTEAPVLAPPDPSLPYELYTDASGLGVGAVLCQGDHIIGYGSQHFSKRELNFSTIEKEAFAVFWGIKHFYPYLYGSQFKVLSDHAPLKWLFKKPNVGGRLGRWQAYLLSFEGLEGIEYIRGADNFGADALSRLLPEEFAVDVMQEQELLTADDLRALQARDSDFSTDFELVHGVWRKNEQIFVPQPLRRRILESFHGNGIHFGIVRTNDMIRSTYFWKGLSSDVSQWIGQCDVCGRAKYTSANRTKPVSLPSTERPFQRISMDYAGPLSRTKSGNRYFLVIVDDFTRYLKVFPVRDCTANTTIKCLRQFCIDEGAPEEILTDNGTHFTADSLAAVLRTLHIRHLRTPPYHPSSNGMAERSVRSVKTLIHAVLLDKLSNVSSWDDLIPDLVSRYNCTSHPATGTSPFVLARGRTPPSTSLSWLDVRLPPKQTNMSWEAIKNSSQSFKLKNCQNRGGKEPPVFQPGDKVWLNRKPGKWEWEEGVVLGKFGLIYRVLDGGGKEHTNVHTNQLQIRN